MVGVFASTLKRSHIRIEIEFDIHSACKDIVEYRIRHLLSDEELGVYAGHVFLFYGQLISADTVQDLQSLFVQHWVVCGFRREAIDVRRLIVAIEFTRLHLDELSHTRVSHLEYLVLSLVRQNT